MGIKELGRVLIQRLKEEAFFPETVIKIYDEAKFDGRPVVHYRMSHVPSPHHKTSSLVAEVSIDKELNIPIYYKALDKDKEGNWIILEEYAFRNIKINPVFKDTEFTEQYPDYGFSKRER
jgi:outer membrane lipoprotein-sorting protein